MRTVMIRETGRHQLNVGVVLDAGRDLDDGVQVACGRANGQDENRSREVAC